MTEESFDILIIGGGPAGATAALRSARSGLRAIVLEADRHPRFHIGESFLPRNLQLIEELGLRQELMKLPQVPKLGASFAFGDDLTLVDYDFKTGLLRRDAEAFNIEREPFDMLLLDVAREAGADIFQQMSVRKVLTLEDGCVEVEARTPNGERHRFRGKYLIDASGQATVIGRHLGIRRALPDQKKIACYGHFEGVARREGVTGGYPIVVAAREGWFWVIPIDARRTSIGLVMESRFAKQTDIPMRQLLEWGISRCPLLRRLTAGATFPTAYRFESDFSYTCTPAAGPGYFLVGDAATFIDPVFSTGVCLGMMSAMAAVDGIRTILDGGVRPPREQARYVRTITQSSAPFFRLVRSYYQHSFRELFLQTSSRFDIYGAVISVLCGHVFPRPAFALRWRLRAFELIVHLQKFVPVAPRRTPFSLLDGSAYASPVSHRDTGN